MNRLGPLVLSLVLLAPAIAMAQSAGEVERRLPDVRAIELARDDECNRCLDRRLEHRFVQYVSTDVRDPFRRIGRMQQDLENARYATARAHDAVEKMLMLGCHVVVPCEQRQART